MEKYTSKTATEENIIFGCEIEVGTKRYLPKEEQKYNSAWNENTNEEGDPIFYIDMLGDLEDREYNIEYWVKDEVLFNMLSVNQIEKLIEEFDYEYRFTLKCIGDKVLFIMPSKSLNINFFAQYDGCPFDTYEFQIVCD